MISIVNCEHEDRMLQHAIIGYGTHITSECKDTVLALGLVHGSLQRHAVRPELFRG